MNVAAAGQQGIGAIVHDVDPRHRGEYERWMLAATQAHRQCRGYLAMDVIKPVGAGACYVVLLRFASVAEASAWLVSPQRRQLLEQVRPWLLREERYRVHAGAAFWFAPAGAGEAPKRWKQWLLSTLAVFPLTTLIPAALRALAEPLAPALPALALGALSATLVSGVMVYWLMPLLSRVAAGWLSR
ncbi:antibiotic biosynthesis monooxygenase [Massilia atriviolacea]|uniref:Antibiotic biosynthesis monooxygenase n=1 Tax=Massilia atriviolacea TaxID=2495579 RepID=A0A430HNU4_9BURK|nr:antibiotic biosynthesis monooxygenase [Massilia atriviolacea]RSZ59206.1 antibiotic biosynthesis monooxygenase [Massilia atriviolacea]